MVNDLNAKASYLLDARPKHFSVISPGNVWVILCNYLLITSWTQTSLRETVDPLPQRPSFPYRYTHTFTSVCSLLHLGLVCFPQLILNKKLWSGCSASVGIGCFPPTRISVIHINGWLMSFLGFHPCFFSLSTVKALGQVQKDATCGIKAKI